MTAFTVADRARARRDLLGRSALCGALAAAAFAAPAFAQLAQSGTALSSGGLPTIATHAGETDVTLHGARTIIDWSTYNVAAGESVHYAFDARNWIVLNRIHSADPAKIEGTIEGRVGSAFGGNIWFSSSSGVLIGAGGQIDAGGILITGASPDAAGFLDPSKLQFDFSGDAITSSTKLTMKSGSSINGHGGLVALISPTTVTEKDSSVNGLSGSSVLYGATNGFTLRLSQGAPGDFDLVDFVIPNSGVGSAQQVAMDLQNTTLASSVFVAAVSRTAAASAVINLEGLITAQAASSDGGDIILSGGGGIVGRQPGPNLGGIDTDIYLGGLAASRDIHLSNAGLVFAKPWQRPGDVPPPIDLSGFGDFSDGGFSTGCFGDDCQPIDPGAVDAHRILGSVNDETFVSNLSAARDIILTTTRNMDVGTAKAGRDLSVDGATMLVNSVSGARNVTLKTETGDLQAGSVSIGGAGLVAAHGGLEVDGLSLGADAAQKTTLTATTNLVLGDGAGGLSGSGALTLTAAGNVVVNLGSGGRIDTVTAGADALLKAPDLNVTTVKAQRILATGDSVKLGSATSAGDIYVSASGDATLGAAVAGDDVYVMAGSGAASLGAATLTGAGADAIGPDFLGNADATGNGRVVSVTSAHGDAKLGLGTGGVAGSTSVNVQAGQDATVDVTALSGALAVSAGRDALLRAPTVSLNAVHAGRDLSLIATTGDLTAGQNLIAVRNITLGAAGALKTADIQADAGSITLTGGTVSAGALSASQDLILKATAGGVQIASYRVGRDLVVQGSTLSLGTALAPIGRDLFVTTPGDFTSTRDLTATRNVSLDITGKATVGVVSGQDVHIVAGDLALGGALTGATVEIESRTGALRVGGAASDAPASGLWLDNAEFGRIHATTSLSLYAGQTSGGARGDLSVLALDVTPTSTPLINLLAGPTHTVTVAGVAAPTVSGGAIRIGDAANAAWRPTSILVSGSVGAATYKNGTYSDIRAFDDVRLNASQDIIMGSQRFIGLIQAASIADIELGKNKPLGVAPLAAEQNHVLISAGRLQMSAGSKVVSQNTAPTVSQSIGIFLTNKSTPNLIIDPPLLVDLFGSFQNPQGQVVSSFSAGGGVSFVVVDSQGNVVSPPAGAEYKFNSCVVDTSQCSGATQLTANLAQDTPSLSGGSSSSDAQADDAGDGGGGSDGSGKGGRKSSSRNGQRAVPPPLLAAAPPEGDEALSDPVTTGAGSEEIWRKHGAKP